jgi:hypothetical protein
MGCNECGTPVSYSIKYCPNCGTYQNQPKDPSKFRVLPGINTSGEVISKLSLAIFVIPILILFVMVSGLITAIPSDGENRETPSIETPTNTPTETTQIPTPTLEHTRTSTPEPTPKPQPNDDDVYIDRLQTNLEDEGIQTEAYEIYTDDNGDKGLIFGYRESPNPSMEEFKESPRVITLEVVNLVEKGWDLETVVVLMGDSDGNAVGQFHIEREWIDDYLDGDISKSELFDRVFDSVVAY